MCFIKNYVLKVNHLILVLQYPDRQSILLSSRKILYKSPGFTWNVITYMLLVSRWKLKKRLLEYGRADVIGFSKISNDKLGNVIGDYWNLSVLACGHSITLGHLDLIGTNADAYGKCHSHRSYYLSHTMVVNYYNEEV